MEAESSAEKSVLEYRAENPPALAVGSVKHLPACSQVLKS